MLSVVSHSYYTCVAMRFWFSYLLLVPLTFAIIACAADEKPTTPGAAGGNITIDGTAVAPADQEAYRQSLASLRPVQETCSFDAVAAVVDCSERGIYKLEPAPANPESACVVGLTGGGEKVEFILCSSPDGSERKYFAIQQ